MSNDIVSSQKQLVTKRNDIIQNAKFCFGDIENKTLSFLLSKIQPEDDPEKLYTFSCQELYRFLNWKKRDTYTDIYALLKNIADRSIYYNDKAAKEVVLVRWLREIKHHEQTDIFEFRFDKTVHPFIYNLQEQKKQNGIYYTSYQIQNVMPLKNKYSQRVYEILKSYQYNNKQWTFELGTGTKHDLHQLIGPFVYDKKKETFVYKIPASWRNIAVFKRDVLEPIKEEINKYTDIKIDYSLSKTDLKGVKHRNNCVVVFYMLEKTESEKKETETIINNEYGMIGHSDNDSVKNAFLQEHEDKLRIEKAEKNKKKGNPKKQSQSSEESESSALPKDKCYEDAEFEKQLGTLASVYPEFTKHQIRGLYYASIPWVRRTWIEKERKFKDFDAKQLDVIDYIDPIYNKIKATPEKTKSTTYDRLYDAVQKNYGY